MELGWFSLEKEIPHYPYGWKEHREEGMSQRTRKALLRASKKGKIHVLCENLLVKPNPRESDHSVNSPQRAYFGMEEEYQNPNL